MKKISLATIVMLLAAFAPHAFAGCLQSGTEATINAALVHPGDAAVLCQNAVFLLSNTVTFTAANQQIYTEGLPTGSARAILRVISSSLSTAITGSQSGLVLRNIEVDGNRPGLGILTGGGANIEIGGNATGQLVDHVYTHDPRGWSTLHLISGGVVNNVERCQSATISNNQIGPAGTSYNNQWADGISLDCSNSVVENNTITDASDGAIVIFGSPGSLIQNNTIIANSNVLLGGINMVDYTTNGNYTGVRVLNNTINAQGALIKVGIAMGPQVWGCSAGTNYGATISGNTLTGANFGYGYPANGVSNWAISNNVDNARHVGLLGTGGCGGTTTQPAGFQYANVSLTSLQPTYSPASLNYVLGITEPAILVGLLAPTACGTINGGQGLMPGQSLISCDGRFTLTLQPGGNLVLTLGTQVIYSTGTAGRPVAQAIVVPTGNFALYDVTGADIWDTNTPTQAGSYLALQNDGNLVLHAKAGGVIWASNSGGYAAQALSMVSTPSTLTIARGQTALYALAITPQGGFTGTLTLSCSGLPAGSSCQFSPITSTLTGNNAVQNVQLQITSQAATASLRVRSQSTFLALLLFPSAALLLSLRRRNPLRGLLLAIAGLAIFSFASGCSSGTGVSPNTATTISTITVLAQGVPANPTNATITQTLNLTMILR